MLNVIYNALQSEVKAIPIYESALGPKTSHCISDFVSNTFYFWILTLFYLHCQFMTMHKYGLKICLFLGS